MMAHVPPPLIVGETPERTRLLVLCVHGRGQTPEDMMPQIFNNDVSTGVRVILPAAPGKSWYKARAIDPMTPATEAQLAASLDLVERAWADGSQDVSASAPRLFVGFSQGACIALEFALRKAELPAALAVLTGARVGQGSPGLPERSLKGVRIYLTGAEDDTWFPPSHFREAARLLGEMGAEVELDVFGERGHAVSQLEIAKVQAILGWALNKVQ